jgi:hypothetical protein
VLDDCEDLDMKPQIKPQAYINFENLDASIDFYLGKIPAGFEGVYTESYVREIINERNNSEKREYDLLGKLNIERESNNLLYEEYKKVESLLSQCMDALIKSDLKAYEEIFPINT